MINQINADVRDWAKDYKGAKFHALLSDPPYHLLPIVKRFGKKNSKPAKNGVYKRTSRGFMGQTWDGGDIAFDSEMWSALGELLYPGAFMFIYAGTRTYHRVAVAVEDAGFIIHPAIGWVTSQGFPKATRIDTQIDRRAGAKRERIGEAKTGVASGTHKHTGIDNAWGYDDDYYETAPATPMAKTWEHHRYGLMALKPSFEFILCAQKPYDARPLEGIISTGAGALNIGAGRVGSRWPPNLALSHLPECVKVGERVESYPINRFTDGAKPFGHGAGHDFETDMQTGTVDIYQCADGCPIKRMNEQASQWTDKDMGNVFYTTPPTEIEDVVKYVPKASPKERDAGLDDFEKKFSPKLNAEGRDMSNPKNHMGGFQNSFQKNTHPTLKPIELNKWLAKLLLPPDEYAPRRLLVPFAGVLSEAIGAELAGWEEITAVELTPEYIPIGKARAEYWTSKNKQQLSFEEVLDEKQVDGGKF